jgi:hypothetical protein
VEATAEEPVSTAGELRGRSDVARELAPELVAVEARAALGALEPRGQSGGRSSAA